MFRYNLRRKCLNNRHKQKIINIKSHPEKEIQNIKRVSL